MITRHSSYRLGDTRISIRTKRQRMELRSIALTRLGTKSYTENFTSTSGCVERAMINVAFLSTRSSNRIIVLCDGLHNIVSASTRHHYEDSSGNVMPMKKFRNAAKLAYIHMSFAFRLCKIKLCSYSWNSYSFCINKMFQIQPHLF